MATTTANLNISSLAYIDKENPNTHYSISSSTWYNLHQVGNSVSKQMLFKLASLSSSLKHNKIYGIRFRVQLKGSKNSSISVKINDGTYTAATVTYANAPGEIAVPYAPSRSSFDSSVFDGADYWFPASLSGTVEEAAAAAAILEAPSLRFYAFSSESNIKSKLSDNTNLYAEVSYDDSAKVASKVSYVSGAKTGYANPRNAQTFSWNFVKANENEYCAEEIWSQASATFYWKAADDANYTSVSAGSTPSVTIPANTFPTATTISWYVTATDDEGTTTSTDVFTFSTAAGTASATPVSPKNSAEDGSNDITFRWALSSTDGQTPSRVEGYWKLYQNISDPWTPMFDVSSPITSYTVPGGTISAGDIAWEIAAYNVDGVRGDYQQARFICIAAPDPVEGLAATNVPFTTISWQSDGQQAYQVSIDGTVVKQAFGSNVYSYSVDEPLADGQHTVSVSVQGIYGYWSQPASIVIDVDNTPDETITLTGDFTGNDAYLEWNGATGNVFIFRDGKKVGVSDKNAFFDRYALGEHSWYVLEKLVDGNYNISNTVSGSVDVESLLVADLNGSEWLPLKLSEKSTTEQTFSFSKQYSTIHVSGAVYPVMELGVYEDIVGGYDCAFSSYEDAKRFEELRGKPIIIKSRGNNVMFGVITQMQSHYGDFVTGYTFGITRIHVEDFVDDTAG